MREIREKIADISLETRIMDRPTIPRNEALSMFRGLMEAVEERMLLVPHYVHEWFQSEKEKLPRLLYIMEEANRLFNQEREDLSRDQVKVVEWLFQEGDVNRFVSAQARLAKMYCDDYIVEEVPRYYVVSPQGKLLLTRTVPRREIVESHRQPRISDLKGSRMYPYQLTEEEIVGYDERYWPFASLIERKDLW